MGLLMSVLFRSWGCLCRSLLAHGAAYVAHAAAYIAHAAAHVACIAHDFAWTHDGSFARVCAGGESSCSVNLATPVTFHTMVDPLRIGEMRTVGCTYQITPDTCHTKVNRLSEVER